MHSTTDAAVAMHMPQRLVDYFVEVVADPSDLSTYADFHRHVVYRLPDADHRDFPLPDGVPYFCIPQCLSELPPSVYERKPTFFSFSLTDGDGARAYGFALHFYDREQPSLGDEAVVWRPRVFCLISHHPFFSLFKEIVSWVYRTRKQTSPHRVVASALANASDSRSWFLSPRAPALPSSKDRLPSLSRTMSEGVSSFSRSFDSVDEWDVILRQIVEKAECPSPGGVLELQFHGQDFFRYHVHRGNVAHLDDYCFQVLFQCLSVENVVYVLNAMLLEQRILIHSNHAGLLTPVCEALCALLFPFTWEHVYVPFLPLHLIEYLQAPVPYIMGLHTSALATRIGAECFSSCVVVHLDKDKVVMPISSRVDDSPMDFVLARLPAHEVDTLLQSIADVVPRRVSGSRSQSATRSEAKATFHTASDEPEDDGHDDEVELTFGEGLLGITFEPTHLRLLAVSNFELGRHCGASAVVKALPRLQNGLPGPAERSGLISPGSFLIGINGDSTLDLSFDETIDRLRTEKRPVRLRFLNAARPHENACQFAERLQTLAMVSAMQKDHSNSLLPWVDRVRSAFAVMFTSIFRDFQRYICIEHVEPTVVPRSTRAKSAVDPRVAWQRRRSTNLSFSITFDHTSFTESSASAQAASQTSPSSTFLREFTQTQCFAGFINDSVMGRVSHTTEAYAQLELFKQCIHLYHELGTSQVSDAIALLFERDRTAIETSILALPTPDHEGEAMTKTSTTDDDPQVERVADTSDAAMRELEMLISSTVSEPQLTLNGPLSESPEVDDTPHGSTHRRMPSRTSSGSTLLGDEDEDEDDCSRMESPSWKLQDSKKSKSHEPQGVDTELAVLHHQLDKHDVEYNLSQ
ncbi:hypothetical protein Poli38472_010245 [Pythium oligandrum]|uniref:UDENN domain-containing protein n=1 Tax=Pythium oligandrum TaxID=41045 RepID=A0A8K1C8L5_PYTOL|nr:hypothetical protein Poli38472_010245 [Pythium oligandrum]|eukprot:TMW58686.1 hypothetical protein Poli38472_010245 [Pythium oligandrum]